MANPGGIGTKFASLNLNKSYGQFSHHNNNPSYSASYGQAATSRGRSFTGGGGMVVLSRTRSSQKAGPKLSVPPPLNLPSLRKEHERFDLSGSTGGSAGSGNGPRPNSSGLGWTKQSSFSSQDKNGNNDVHGVSGGDTPIGDGVHQNVNAVDGVSRGSGIYMPPSAQSGSVGGMVSASARVFQLPAEKATVLRGEDFPSLRDVLPTTPGPIQKQKDGLHKKKKQDVVDESFNEQKDRYQLRSTIHMPPQGRSSSQQTVGNDSCDIGVEVNELGGSRLADQASWKQEEYFPGPLPLVRFNPRSDWADDERDTGHGFANNGRDHGFTKTEAYWDTDFDIIRSNVLPHRPANHQFNRRDLRDNETGRSFSSEVTKVDPYRRDVRTPSREGLEGNARRTSFSKDGFHRQEAVEDKNSSGAKPTGLTRDAGKENRYIPQPFINNARDSGLTGNHDSAFRRRDMGHSSEGRQQWNHSTDSISSQGPERNSVYVTEPSSRYRIDAFKNGMVSNSPFSSGYKDLPMNDSVPGIGRLKCVFSKSEGAYGDDRFAKDFTTSEFEENDPFSGVVGIIKRKKEVTRQTDFHDPVRESFEAELERVQKMQEIERQRIIEEQERALEQARREEEERQRLIREEEERQRRQEEEARETAWRAEQERMEAIRRAEEQKLAREDEKMHIIMEEERRKQAAKQKLLDLEARIAKRQAETRKGDNSTTVSTDDKMLGTVNEKDVSRTVNLDNWDDNERVVERVTISMSNDSSVVSRPIEMGSWPQSSKEVSSGILDRGKPLKSWRRDVFDDGTSSSSLIQGQENMHRFSRRDSSVSGRSLPRKDLFGGSAGSRNYFRAGVQEPCNDEFIHLKEQHWNLSGDRGQDTLAEKYGDIGWGQAPSHCISRSPFPDQFYPNSEAEELYSYGRSRYAMRQPRVLPPPSFAPMHRTFRDENERSGSSAFPDNDVHYSHAARSETNLHMGYYDVHEEKQEPSVVVEACQGKTMSEEQKVGKTATQRCDSQSSLSVSSPPNSPPHLSNDELDESGESPLRSSVTEGKDFNKSGTESVVLNEKSGKETSMAMSSISVSAGEDDEWTLENNGELQEQEEYDEDEDGYQEEDEAREGEDDLDLAQEFENMHVQDGDSSGMMDNLVLGFNEGVEVGIPIDDFERNSRNDDSAYGIPQVSDGKEEYADGVRTEEQEPPPVDSHSQVSKESLFGRIQGTENMQDSFIQPIHVPHTSAVSNDLDFVGVSGSSVSAVENIVSSYADVAVCSSSCQTVTTTAASFSNQPDLPVKVHLGLFSGPSLIPSPIPAIQIGSIQMPLHLHPTVGSSLTHMHQPQPPLFQFGQLRYTSPNSQGILPTASQSMPFVQPNMHSHYNLNHNSQGSLPIRSTQENFTQGIVKDDVLAVAVDNKRGVVPRPQESAHEKLSRELNSVLSSENAEKDYLVHNAGTESSQVAGKKPLQEPSSQAEDKGHQEAVAKNYMPSLKERGSEGQSKNAHESTDNYGKEYRKSKTIGPVSGGKGKRFSYSVRNSGARSFDASHSDSSGFQKRSRRAVQRTEFRVRENVDGRHSSAVVSANDSCQDVKLINGKGAVIFSRNGSNRVSTRPLKQMTDSEGSNLVPVNSQEIGFETGALKETAKETIAKSSDVLRLGNLKRNISEEDVDAALQTGIVRVFKQSGIEAPSDEDDFIEVRSKRQMLNDRREQREKEIKAKSRFSKGQRKTYSATQNAFISTYSSKVPASPRGDASKNVHSEVVVSDVQAVASKESSLGLTSMLSQPLAPIGTPVLNVDSRTDMGSHMIKSLQTSSASVISGAGKDLASGLIFEMKDQVMALTQTQLDDAMKPAQYDTHATSIGGHASSASEPMLPSSSILAKGKAFSSAASPISSLLAGEKIQFGALTSPTALPPSSHNLLHGIGVPGSIRPDIQISHKLPAAGNDCSLFFEKDKEHNGLCVNLEDCEAEAAASAVAVAAISSDEIVGHGLGSISIADGSRFGGADVDRLTEGVTGDQQSGSQSRAEDSLSVSLPADLSVEMPPISLWPTLSSPQNSSLQTLTHFPGGPLPHFPFYEMNTMLGGPIFAFGPHEESGGNQSQSQKSTASGTGPLGTWQQCHSTMDSFYGPPAGFNGPFISPPVGIPGVQIPPHMVVYNHFAPVGQFGQVGLSFMGSTYIPSGKQPDWKHTPTTSSMGIGEGEVSNLKLASGQCIPSNMHSPIQNIAPGSSLLSMAPPLAMFDVSPFQSAPDISNQAQWSHVPVTPLHSLPMSLPLQQPAEGSRPLLFNHGHPADQSINIDRFSDSQNPSSSEKVQSFPVVTDAIVGQISDGLGLMDSSSSITTGGSIQRAINQGAENTISDTGSADVIQKSSCDINKCQNTNSFKTQPSHQKNLSAQQYNHSTGYNYQRNGVSQKNNSGGDWSNRRMGFHGRNQYLSAEKGFPPKVKQIYVAKQNTSGTPKTG